MRPQTCIDKNLPGKEAVFRVPPRKFARRQAENKLTKQKQTDKQAKNDVKHELKLSVPHLSMKATFD